jgi:hypothetical protein
MTEKDWRGSRPTLAAFFEPGWRHKRVDDELADAQAKYERLSAAGKKGGRPKTVKPLESEAFETLKPQQSEAESDHEANAKQPITDNPKEEERKISPSARAVGTPTRTGLKARVEELFEELWAKKPKRDGANPKTPALKKFLRIVPFGEVQGEAKAREIIDACQRWAEAERKSGREGKETVAQLITWLNQSRWGDYPPTTAVNAVQPAGFYAADSTPELDAWDAHYRATRGINAPRDHHFGWRFPTQWPPNYEVKHHEDRNGEERAQTGMARGRTGGEEGRDAENRSIDHGLAAAPSRPPGAFTIE